MLAGGWLGGWVVKCHVFFLCLVSPEHFFLTEGKTVHLYKKTTSPPFSINNRRGEGGEK